MVKSCGKHLFPTDHLSSQLGLKNTLTASQQRGKTPPNKCPWYDTKQSDDEVPVMLELWGMQSTLSLPLLPGSLRLGVVAPDRVLFLGQIELNCVLMLNWIVWNRTVSDIETVLTLNWIVWNRTVLTFNCIWTKTLLIPNWIVWIRIVRLNWIDWNRNVFDN